jgi:hypothetical protein
MHWKKTLMKEEALKMMKSVLYSASTLLLTRHPNDILTKTLFLNSNHSSFQEIIRRVGISLMELNHQFINFILILTDNLTIICLTLAIVREDILNKQKKRTPIQND